MRTQPLSFTLEGSSLLRETGLRRNFVETVELRVEQDIQGPAVIHASEVRSVFLFLPQ